MNNFVILYCCLGIALVLRNTYETLRALFCPVPEDAERLKRLAALRKQSALTTPMFEVVSLLAFSVAQILYLTAWPIVLSVQLGRKIR